MRGALSGRGLRRRRLRYILLLPVSVSACLPGRAGIERILITQRLIGRLGLRACGRRRARARADTGLPNLAQFGAIGPGQGTLASPGLLLTCPHTICPRASARLLFACKRRLCLRASAAFVCVQAHDAAGSTVHKTYFFPFLRYRRPARSWGASRRPRPRALEPKHGKERSNGNHTRERSHPAIGA
jgi:hypothetical protein